MYEPALDDENRTVVTCLRWLPYIMGIHTKRTGLFQKNPSQTGDRDGGDMEFPRVLKNVEIPGVN